MKWEIKTFYTELICWTLSDGVSGNVKHMIPGHVLQIIITYLPARAIAIIIVL